MLPVEVTTTGETPRWLHPEDRSDPPARPPRRPWPTSPNTWRLRAVRRDAVVHGRARHPRRGSLRRRRVRSRTGSVGTAPASTGGYGLTRDAGASLSASPAGSTSSRRSARGRLLGLASPPASLRSPCMPGDGHEPSASVIGLLIVDDHPVVRDGLRRHVRRRSRVLRARSMRRTGRDAVALCGRALKPDVVLMDLRMPEMDGTTAIKVDGLPRHLLLVSSSSRPSTPTPTASCHRGGATGPVEDAAVNELFRAVRGRGQGGNGAVAGGTARVLGQVRRPAKETVSERELEVLRLVARRRDQARRRPRLRQQGDGKDAPAPHLRQARRQHRGRRGYAPPSSGDCSRRARADNARLLGGEGGRQLLYGRGVVLGCDTDDHQVETGLEQQVGRVRPPRRDRAPGRLADERKG